MNPKLDAAEARRILTQAYSEIEKSSKVPVKAAIYQKLCDAGLQELAEILMLYSAMEGAVSMSGTPNYTFNISGTVGNLNLGEQIGQITTSLTVVSQQGPEAAEFAAAVKSLTEEVLRTPDLGDAQKKEAIAVIDTVAAQAKEPLAGRNSGIIRALLAGFPTMISTAAGVADLWEKLGPTIRDFFGL